MAMVSATVCNVERSRTSCQNVETEFMTPAATVLHNKSFLHAAAMTYLLTPYVAHYRHVTSNTFS